jgi:hypothetical protein
LDDVRAAIADNGLIEQGTALRDQLAVPTATVLLVQQNDFAIGVACGASGVVAQHERQQPERFRLVGHQRGEHPPEPDRLVGQIVPAAVALVEDEVDHLQHHPDALGQHMVRWHPEGNARHLDLGLRPGQAPLHGSWRDQERLRDLIGGHATQRPQGECDLRVDRERGMAAHEDQLEPFVRNRGLDHVGLLNLRHLE